MITKQPKLYVLSLTTDRPLALSSVNIVIAYNGGLFTAIEATTEKLQASKNTPTPSLTVIIKNMNRENSRLREELAYQSKMQELGIKFEEEISYITKRL